MQSGADSIDDRQPRISVKLIGSRMLMSVIGPVTVAMVVDFVTGSWPLLTLICATIAIPVGGILVLRTTMHELQRVLDELAPVDESETDGNGGTG